MLVWMPKFLFDEKSMHRLGWLLGRTGLFGGDRLGVLAVLLNILSGGVIIYIRHLLWPLVRLIPYLSWFNRDFDLHI